ncbi:MAG: Crp/Fnr family transcriptional regulator [Polyangiales bacterium]
MTADDERAIAELGAHMDRAQRTALLAVLTPREIAAGDVIAREGEARDALEVIVKGNVALSLRDADGHVLEVATLGPGRAFGEPSLLEGLPAGATATAQTATRVLGLSRAALDDLRRREPRVASLLLRALIEDLAERVRTANTAIERDGEALRLASPQKHGFLARTLGRLFGSKS